MKNNPGFSNQQKQEFKGIVKVVVSQSLSSQVPSIVNNAIETQVPPIVSNVIKTQVPPIVNDIVEKKLTPIKKDIQGIRKDIKFIINFFDREYLDHEKRLDKVENHLGFGTA